MDVPSLSRSIKLDVTGQVTAAQAIHDCLQQLFSDTSDLDTAGWILRARTRAEEGKWWMEQEIRNYRDREQPFLPCST